VSEEAWESFNKTMYSGDFLFNVSREFVAHCQTPLLVLLGNDLHHPAETSREIAALAPNARLIEHWKEPEYHQEAQKAVEDFLAAHTPR
jgi:hypothetical protein